MVYRGFSEILKKLLRDFEHMFFVKLLKMQKKPLKIPSILQSLFHGILLEKGLERSSLQHHQFNIRLEVPVA